MFAPSLSTDQDRGILRGLDQPTRKMWLIKFPPELRKILVGGESSSSSFQPQIGRISILTTQSVVLELDNPPPGVDKAWHLKLTQFPAQRTFVLEGQGPGDVTSHPLDLVGDVEHRAELQAFDPESNPMPKVVARSTLSERSRYDRNYNLPTPSQPFLTSGRLVPAPPVKLKVSQDVDPSIPRPVVQEVTAAPPKRNRKADTHQEMMDKIFSCFEKKQHWKIGDIQRAIDSNNNKKVKDILNQICDQIPEGDYKKHWVLKQEIQSSQKPR